MFICICVYCMSCSIQRESSLERGIIVLGWEKGGGPLRGSERAFYITRVYLLPPLDGWTIFRYNDCTWTYLPTLRRAILSLISLVFVNRNRDRVMEPRK